MGERPRKAYRVVLKGTIYRHYVVHADSGEHAAEIMRGDREEIEQVDDYFEERCFERPRRWPEEDDAQEAVDG